jgi:hypothetical protein
MMQGSLKFSTAFQEDETFTVQELIALAQAYGLV